MLFHEAVYTSASTLLESSSGSDLGIVAKSRGFPTNVERELAGEQYYSLLPDISIHDLQAHPPRLVVASRGEQKEYFCLSRSVFAGADHTGRTTPLSHHLVFNVDEMKAERTSPAAILAVAHSLFYREWKKPPQWITPLRMLPPTASPERQREFPSPSWGQLLHSQPVGPVLALMAEQLLAFPKTRRPLVICIPISRGEIVDQIMADLLALVPEIIQLQLGSASHVIKSGDCPADTAIVFTYPTTSFFSRQVERADPNAPVIFNLASETSLPGQPGKYGATLATILQSNQSAEQLALLRMARSVVESGPGTSDFFMHLWKLQKRFRGVNSSEDISILAQETARIVTLCPSSEELFAQWVSAMVIGNLAQLSSTLHNEAIATIAWNKHKTWPRSIQQLALNAISDNPNKTLPAFLTQLQSGTNDERSALPFLKSLLAKQPNLVDPFLSDAVRTNTEQTVSQAILLINASAPAIETLIGWTTIASKAINPVRLRLFAALQKCLCASSNNHTPKWLEEVLSKFSEPQKKDTFFRQHFHIPLLQQLLAEPSASPDSRQLFLISLIEIALRERLSAEKIANLASPHDHLITPTVLQSWSQSAAALGQAEMYLLANAIQILGFQPPPDLGPIANNALPNASRPPKLPKPNLAPPLPSASNPLPTTIDLHVSKLSKFSSRITNRAARRDYGVNVVAWMLGACVIALVGLLVWDHPFASVLVPVMAVIILNLIIEIVLRSVDLPARYLGLTKWVRWLAIAAIIVAFGLSIIWAIFQLFVRG